MLLQTLPDPELLLDGSVGLSLLRGRMLAQRGETDALRERRAREGAS